MTFIHHLGTPISQNIPTFNNFAYFGSKNEFFFTTVLPYPGPKMSVFFRKNSYKVSGSYINI